jgi:ubiquinone/menaquinone biosynthesis C-methylase UbiE
MTWEETILHVRKLPAFQTLIEDAFLSADLVYNATKYYSCEEYQETIALLQPYLNNFQKPIRLLDIGAGNGISSIAFAKDGFSVCALEPDESPTVGINAINYLVKHFHLSNVQIFKGYAENLPFDDNSFDIVYARQSMHHAADLNKFIGEAYRVLAKGGLLLTVRDHVVFSKKEKKHFLLNHPLNKFYNGENAYSLTEYKKAFINNQFSILKILTQYDSPINHFPLTRNEYELKLKKHSKDIKESLVNKLGSFGKNRFLLYFYKLLIECRYGRPFNERKLPGRPYSFLSKKK